MANAGPRRVHSQNSGRKNVGTRSARTASPRTQRVTAPEPPSVAAYTSELPPAQRAIVNGLRALVKKAVPSVMESLRWGMPVFSTGRLLCYARVRLDVVRFGFYTRIPLADPTHRLVGSPPYVDLRRKADIDARRFADWVSRVAAEPTVGERRPRRARLPFRGPGTSDEGVRVLETGRPEKRRADGEPGRRRRR
jgi:hypothetical protein